MPKYLNANNGDIVELDAKENKADIARLKTLENWSEVKDEKPADDEKA